MIEWISIKTAQLGYLKQYCNYFSSLFSEVLIIVINYKLLIFNRHFFIIYHYGETTEDNAYQAEKSQKSKEPKN